MAQNENDFQREIVDETNLRNGHGSKVSTHLTIGIPDLYLKPKTAAPGHYGMWVECKFVKPRPAFKTLTLELATLHQYEFLINEQSAGGIGLIFVGYAMQGRHQWGLLVATPAYMSLHERKFTVTPEHFDPDQPYHFRRPLGGSWPMDDIFAFIIDQISYEGPKPFLNTP